MNVLSNETVKTVFKLASESLEKSGDLIISKQVIVAAFAEIIETRKKKIPIPTAPSVSDTNNALLS